jgi:hypothetical protein
MLGRYQPYHANHASAPFALDNLQIGSPVYVQIGFYCDPSIYASFSVEQQTHAATPSFLLVERESQPLAGFEPLSFQSLPPK